MRNANLKWKIEVDTTPELETEDFKEIKGMESLEFSFEDEVQTGFFLSDNGYGYSDVTAGRLTVSLTGKRVVGDDGQDFIVGLVGAWGNSRKSTLKLTNEETNEAFEIPSSIEIGTVLGGGAEELEEFEVTFHSDGEWTATSPTV